mgnify:CR=1 FL=1
MPRDRRRRGRSESRPKNFIKQLPWKQPRNPYQPYEIISSDQVEAIHQASLRILKELGIAFLDEESLDILQAHGAEVDRSTQMVRFAPELIEEHLSKAPSEFTFYARNSEHNLEVGGNHTIFCLIGSAPNSSDLDQGRRSGNFKDFENLIRLAQYFNIIHMIAGYPVEPVDLPPETRHLDCALANLTMTDKVIYAYSLGKARVSDTIDMLCIARGKTREEIKKEPGLLSIINTSSPLRVDGPMLQGMMEMVRNGQCVCVTPFTLAGAMAPVTLAGALSQQNAEALAGIAFIQIVKPGAPIIYGGLTSNVDMKSGSPAFGTPEFVQAAFGAGQLARHIGLPWRGSAATASNAPDEQSVYEFLMSAWGSILGGVNMMVHAAGWLEGGLTASMEKFILDIEALQIFAEIFKPLNSSDDELAFDAIAAVEPGGHFFGCEHQKRFFEQID